MTKKEWIKFGVQTLIYLLTALASALGVSSCVKSVKSSSAQTATITTLADKPCADAHKCTTCGHWHHCHACGDPDGN